MEGHEISHFQMIDVQVGLGCLFPPSLFTQKNNYTWSKMVESRCSVQGFLGLELMPMIIGEKNPSQPADLGAPSAGTPPKNAKKLEAIKCETWSTMAPMKTHYAYLGNSAWQCVFVEIDSHVFLLSTERLVKVVSPRVCRKNASVATLSNMTLFHGDTVSLHPLAIWVAPEDPVRSCQVNPPSFC